MRPTNIKKKSTYPKALPGGLSRKQQAILEKNGFTGAPETRFPKTVKPMLATLVDSPPAQEGWLYEVKWDGYRAVALCHHNQVNLISRNNKSFNDKFYPVYEALVQLDKNAVIDGEICVLNENGVAHFGALQNWRSEADGELAYYIFDLLWYEGRDLTGLPLTERRALLEALIPSAGVIRYSESFDASPAKLLAATKKMGMEGIMAKKADSIYIQDRSRDWLKIKTNKRHEVVIGGFTNNEGSPKPFSSLLVGVYENGALRYTGKIGTGFNARQQKEMMQAFRKLIIKKCPFKEVPDVNQPSRFRPNPPLATATWLKPVLVCEVSYAEITGDGVMRHPSFEGMRTDKPAKTVTAEQPLETADILPGKKQEKMVRLTKPVTKHGRKSLLNPSEATQVKQVNHHQLKFSNLGKKFWPTEGYTKRDMLNYYYQVAPYIIPYLLNRPQSLNRYPNGINGKSFYQKDVTTVAPEWVKQFPYRTSEGEDKNYLVVEDEASLLWMANLGAIEMNPWNSTIHQPDNPDWCLIDLDPDKGNTFQQVIQTAQVVHQVLENLGVKSYPKTSGSTGIHIYIPLGAKYTYDQCQLFGKLIAATAHEQLPAFTSIERMTRNRKGCIYIDYLQNRPKATLAAPYSLRPKPGATVSMPLHWEEVRKGLKMTDFTIKNALERIRSEGDLFKPVLGRGVNLERLLKKFST
ncbi:DNA ligase D [Chitinophaga sp.]|uniref:DNA ligase D n=1 Tax=Chitinophaga sp. TaxID=1869181 RepID=UPI002BC89015|nr:DNA ligase D [Chitinophaga sp.]HWV69522.1 DNA ligase D [Chitinophaga sp.]